MTNYTKTALLQERLTLVLEYERIKNKKYYYNQERNHGGIHYLTPIQKFFKLEVVEDLQNHKGRSVEAISTINSNHCVTELVR